MEIELFYCHWRYILMQRQRLYIPCTTDFLMAVRMGFRRKTNLHYRSRFSTFIGIILIKPYSIFNLSPRTARMRFRVSEIDEELSRLAITVTSGIPQHKTVFNKKSAYRKAYPKSLNLGIV